MLTDQSLQRHNLIQQLTCDHSTMLHHLDQSQGIVIRCGPVFATHSEQSHKHQVIHQMFIRIKVNLLHGSQGISP